MQWKDFLLPALVLQSQQRLTVTVWCRMPVKFEVTGKQSIFAKQDADEEDKMPQLWRQREPREAQEAKL